MQKIILDTNQDEPSENQWATGRRDFLLRQLFHDYYRLRGQSHILPESDHGRVEVLELYLQLGQQMASNCGFCWPQAESPPISSMVKLLLHQLEKMVATAKMLAVTANEKRQQRLGHEIGEQQHDLAALLAQADTIFHDLLCGQAANPLLLRLLLENPQLPVTLWQKELVDLMADIFPDVPENGFLSAGKSYFSGHWLAEALAAFNQALEINQDMEEARRRSYIVKGMLRDQEKRNKEVKN